MRPPRIKWDVDDEKNLLTPFTRGRGAALLHLIPGEQRGDQRLGWGLIRRRLTAIDAIRSAAAAGR